MSSNKTASYNLHLWEPGDHFLRSEFNENFSALDAIPEVVIGTYTGDGAASREIALGFQPKLAVVSYRGDFSSGYTSLAVPGGDGYSRNSSLALRVTQAGFMVFQNTQESGTNVKAGAYYFLAVR